MAEASTEFTAEEIADFEDALKDEAVIKKIERLNTWRKSKEPKPSETPLEAKPEAKREITLSEIKSLMSDPQTKSILKTLLEMPEALASELTETEPATEAAKKEKEAGRKARPGAPDPLAALAKSAKKWI